MPKTNVIIIIVAAATVIVALTYLIMYVMRNNSKGKLAELEKRKEALFDLPVIEEVDDVKRMHMVGLSQNTFREWSERWNEVLNTSFAELESQIFEVENLNEKFHFMRARKAVAEAEKIMDEMETEVEEIRRGLQELREGEERNSLEVQKALDVYEELRNQLAGDTSIYGPAYSELQKQVKNIEVEFTQFVTLNTSGDPIEAREVLEQAEQHTYEISDLMNRIPAVHEELYQIFPSQIKEIEEAYKRMMREKYVFPEKEFKADIDRVKKRIKNSMGDLEKTEVDVVEVANRDTASSIDSLYDILEREMEGKRYVTKNRKTVLSYIEHTTKNNQQLLVELDHTSQSYSLNHNELGRTRGFQTEIDELIRRNNQMEPLLKEHDIAFSEVQKFYKDVYRVLEDIEAQQLEIDTSVRELRQGEKVAQEQVEAFEFELRSLKRFVEKQRLPGLSKDYLEFFYMATERVELLSKSLNKIRINMDEINKLVKLCQEDIESLTKQTHDLVDAAALTEQMMQYANRYRHSHQDVNYAIENALHLFGTEYRYQEALDEIGTALERVEPGAFQRLESFYFNNPDLV
ncbi:septation ring formation regulator [Enterococcus sp. PF1-24]|uniref:septation ring formation regulator EzrA n=1 Tax=unclassified Enterococcus TaxID=2608891 RepID=UPI002476A4A9|nr:MULTISPECIES: septation ring formation regulator EzrA [unclassified Enterococcus]MDH6365723.1 septation ring formation regulator [Enterococcus sp. PFB1-1]MDH6402819.1 septation ring formation regulator [Enterococcus sp. PF1-24]